MVRTAVFWTAPKRRVRDSFSASPRLRVRLATLWLKWWGSGSYCPHCLRFIKYGPNGSGLQWLENGATDLTVTANTYTHVLVDEAEIDYAQLLS